jgi:hypothetical protein
MSDRGNGMSLKALEVIDRALVSEAPISYEWDRPVFRKLNGYKSENLKRVLLEMSAFANLAFALGVTEWISRRLEGFTDCKAILDYSEGVWASMIDRRYLQREETDDVEYTWADPARDVIMYATNRICLAYYHCWGLDPDRLSDIMQLVAAARHVLADKKPFEVWTKQVLSRLVADYPTTEGVGAPVPREVLEVDQQYEPQNASLYLTKFLQGLVPAENAFLADPDTLAKVPDLHGSPYKTAQ